MAPTQKKNTPAILLTERGFVLDTPPAALSRQGEELLAAFARDPQYAFYQRGGWISTAFWM